jgi:hypothetical protein
MVSTVKLPFKHNGGQFETMVFTVDEAHKVTAWYELDMQRYETEEEAKTGHLMMMAKFGTEDK